MENRKKQAKGLNIHAFISLRNITTIMIPKMARITANRTIQGASGPASTTMGEGPININTPKFVEPLESTAATMRMMIPTI